MRRFEASPQGDSEGPTFIGCTAPPSPTITHSSRPPAFVAHRVLTIPRRALRIAAMSKPNLERTSDVTGRSAHATGAAKALVKGVALVKAVTESDRPLRLTQLAEATALPRPHRGAPVGCSPRCRAAFGERTRRVLAGAAVHRVESAVSKPPRCAACRPPDYDRVGLAEWRDLFLGCVRNCRSTTSRRLGVITPCDWPRTSAVTARCTAPA